MAKQSVNIDAQARQLIEDARAGVFNKIYLLMGDEPYYPELVCKAVIDNCIDESFRDFNQAVLYGSEVNAEEVVTQAREFPMMTERRLVVLKEAQLMKDIDKLSFYVENPLDTTVLVVVFYGASADKRKAFYKGALKNGAVLDSPALRDYELAPWINSYYSSCGLDIDPLAAQLLAESAGADLGKIADETDKLLKNLPEGVKEISVSDIEKNVGISRSFSIFELSNALMKHEAAKALRLATYIGSAARFAMPPAVSALFMNFNRILRLNAGADDALAGVAPYFHRDYESAARHYSLEKSIKIVSLLTEYDYKGKGGDGESLDSGTLLLELVTKILNI